MRLRDRFETKKENRTSRLHSGLVAVSLIIAATAATFGQFDTDADKILEASLTSSSQVTTPMQSASMR